MYENANNDGILLEVQATATVKLLRENAYV
jgi:hypothetical protein